MDTLKPILGDVWLALYAYEAPGAEILWQVGVPCTDEEEAIAYALSMVNVAHIRIVKIEGVEKFQLPDTLKSFGKITAGVQNYGEGSDTQQHEG